MRNTSQVKKIAFLDRLLIGLMQSKLREASNSKEQILEMLFSANEETAALAWVLINAMEVSLEKELSLFESNLWNSNDQFYISSTKRKEAFLKHPGKTFQSDTSWILWDIHTLSPLIKYRKGLCFLTIAMVNQTYWGKKERIEKTGRLKYLPNEIGELGNLEYLQISRMPIVELPKTLLGLKKLERLIITHTTLKSLPPDIHLLEKLEVLVLADNKFQTLPEELGQLKELKVFEIKNNPLDINLIPKVLFDTQHSSRVVVRALEKFFNL